MSTSVQIFSNKGSYVNFTNRIIINKQKLRQYIEQGLSSSQIAEICNTKVSYIEYLKNVYDLTPAGLLTLQKNEQQIFEMKNKRMNFKQIVEKTGLSLNAVKTIFKNSNLGKLANEKFETVRRLEPKSQLSSYSKKIDARRQEICNQIIQFKKAGLSEIEIAKKLKKSVGRIKEYLKFIEKRNMCI